MESKPLLADQGETGAGGVGGGVSPREHEAVTDSSGVSANREFDFSKEKKIDRVYFTGGVLAFWLVFSMWCLWNSFLEYTTRNEGEYPNTKSIMINVGTIAGSLFVLLVLRYGVGPVLGPISRSVFSLVLVFFAICFWEILEGLIAVSVGDNLKVEIFVYAGMLTAGLLLTAVYEYITNYDVIGNHLLL